MATVQESVDEFVIKVMQAAYLSGLSLDESIWALGIAARGIANYNAELTGDARCADVARQSFEDGFTLPRRFIIVGSDMSRLREAYAEALPMIVKSIAQMN